MKHIQKVRVYYADTDAYKVVWHGAYIKWFEAGRIEFADKLGLNLTELEKENCILPVVELNIRYKRSAFLDDKLIIETEIKELNKTSIVFEHKVINEETGVLHVLATVTVVVVDNSGKLYRKVPEKIEKAFKNSLI